MVIYLNIAMYLENVKFTKRDRGWRGWEEGYIKVLSDFFF